MKALDRLHARVAGLSRKSAAFGAEPEPRTLGSYAIGRQLAVGKVILAGQAIDIGKDGSLFTKTRHPQAFEAEAQGFAWLDDLAAYGNAEARTTARRWTGDWLRLYGRGAGPGWTAELAGRRLRRWIHHGLLLGGEDTATEAALAKARMRQTLFLARRWHTAAPGLPRLEALSGLLLAGLSLNGMQHLAPVAAKGIAAEAARCVDPEGGLANRCPSDLLAMFSLLTGAASDLAEAGIAPEPAHQAAIARMAPVLRALRHADGGLARFQGGHAGAEGQLERGLAAARLRSPPLQGLAMGYSRVAHGRTTLIMDAAPPPQGANSARAHASTLAIEVTSGRRPLIVGCGAGEGFGGDWAMASRATASHSTLEILGFSSSRFGRLKTGAASGLLAEVPADVRIQKTVDGSGAEIVAAHDGYVPTHGLTHMRRLAFASHGREIVGSDTLAAVKAEHQKLFETALIRMVPTDDEQVGIAFAVRFHLHPEVEAVLAPNGPVTLTLLSGETWAFRHDGAGKLTLEPSVWLEPGQSGPRATSQLVLTATALDYASRLRWSLEKTRDTPVSVRDTQRDEAPWLKWD